MAKPSRKHEIEAALLDAVASHPRDLVRAVMAQLALSRPSVLARVDALVEAGYLQRDGNRTRPTYGLGPNRRIAMSFRARGQREDALWSQHVAPLVGAVPENVRDICHYGFTEMVNNVVDHADARTLRIEVDVSGDATTIVVGDDGVGIFRKITRHLDLPDERLALLELAKGKLTTDPRRHTGEGVFFTSRVFDRFVIHSGALSFSHRGGADDLLLDFDTDLRGTTVVMSIARDARTTLADTFARYSSGPDDHSFARTVVPVRLAKLGTENLVSRSQAKRLLQRVDRFRIVVLDFDGVAEIGQAFADEIFRVFVAEHGETRIDHRNAGTRVLAMIRRAEAAGDESWRVEETQGELFGSDP